MLTRSAIVPVLAVAASLAVSVSCNENPFVAPQDECGPRRTPQVNLSFDEKLDYSDLGTGESVVNWRISVVNLCTFVHATAEVFIQIQKCDGCDFEAWVLYGVNRLRDMQLAQVDEGTQWEYSGSDNFGVRDVYGDGPGEFTFGASFYFPSQGSAAADETFFRAHVRDVQAKWMKADYYVHKAQ